MIDHTVDFVPTVDSLARNPPLAYSADLPVLGIETRFETNSRYVVSVVDEAFGGWRCLASRPGVGGAGEGVTVRIVVRGGSEHGPAHAPIQYLCPDATRLIVHSPGSVGISDPVLRESVAYVTTELAADRAHFRVAMLEAITFALLSHFDRHPIHAAAVARDGRAVLLAGPSGAGKSTLTYLAHQAGIDVLGDDHVWVQLAPDVRVWGGSRRVRLTADMASQFPGVERAGVLSTTDRKRKIVVDLDDARDGSAQLVAQCAAVCLLETGDAAPSLERLDAPAIVAALTESPAPGFDRFPDRHESVVRAIARNGGWRLRLSSDPRAALPLLLRMLDER
ncbi:MAG: hypothetical protein ABJF01_01325 [bacterium]